MHKIKYSIIIPTRNGLHYLQYAIETVLSSNRSDFELIVSDNHSIDGTNEYLSSSTDIRLKIVKPKKPLSLTEHFEFILQTPRGQWITILGDDDGIQPYFFELADKITGKWPKIEVFNSPRATFFWPGLEKTYGNSVFSFTARSGYSVKKSKRDLFDLTFSGTCFFDYPQFYTGTLFSKELLNKVRESTINGKVYTSPAHDANSAVQILLNTNYYIKINTPLCWIGSSPKSIGIQNSSFKQGFTTDKNQKIIISEIRDLSNLIIDPKFKTVLALDCIHLYHLEALHSTIANRKIKPPEINYTNSNRRHAAFYWTFQKCNQLPHISTHLRSLLLSNKLEESEFNKINKRIKLLAPINRAISILKRNWNGITQLGAIKVKLKSTDRTLHPDLKKTNLTIASEHNSSKILKIINTL